MPQLSQSKSKINESYLRVAQLSSHIVEAISDKVPHFPLRPLWVTGEPKEIAPICAKACDLGYNALIFSHNQPALPSIIAEVKKHGLKVIVQFHFDLSFYCPADEHFHEHLAYEFKKNSDLLQEIDFVLWESLHLKDEFEWHESAINKTHFELIALEAKIIEKIIPKTGLIFLFKTGDLYADKMPRWLQALLDEVSIHTIIAFYENDEVFQSLRTCPHPSATKLMPIVSITSAPIVEIAHLEKIYTYLFRHPFEGVMTQIDHLPEERSFAESSLWVSAQMQWTYQSPTLLFESWILAYKSYFKDKLLLIREMENLNNEIKKLKSHSSNDEIRAAADAISFRLIYLQMNGLKFDLQEIQSFVDDAKSKLSKLSQTLSFSLRI